MELTFIANTDQQSEVIKKGIPNSVKVNWVKDIDGAKDHINSDAFFDLQFEEGNIEQRVIALSLLSPKPVFINAVHTTLSGSGLSENFIRMNAWPGFIERSIIELSCNEKMKPAIEYLFKALNWNYKCLPDIRGFYSARIIASVINEAYFTFGDQVSSKEEIDIAMKLGTNYTFGPFEWAEKIGIKKIYALLQKLSKEDLRYRPAPSLIKEAELS